MELLILLTYGLVNLLIGFKVGYRAGAERAHRLMAQQHQPNARNLDDRQERGNVGDRNNHLDLLPDEPSHSSRRKPRSMWGDR